MKPHALGIAALTLGMAFGGAAPVRAAPATSDDLAGPVAGAVAGPTAGPAPAMGLAVPANAGIEQSRTIELLLQMQVQADTRRDAGRQLPTGETTRRGSAPAPVRVADPAAPATPHPLLELKESLLGSGSGAGSALAGGPAAEGRVDRQAATPSALSPAGPETRMAPAESRSSLLSHPVIRFIRENRGLTIAASLGVLVAVWLGANFRGRAHRR
ncbi:MAG: hypothetical protein IPM99_17020 [Rubrivivax sp.]|nr:hypothetical protein [Rubrivivax sp.]